MERNGIVSLEGADMGWDLDEDFVNPHSILGTWCSVEIRAPGLVMVGCVEGDII